MAKVPLIREEQGQSTFMGDLRKRRDTESKADMTSDGEVPRSIAFSAPALHMPLRPHSPKDGEAKSRFLGNSMPSKHDLLSLQSLATEIPHLPHSKDPRQPLLGTRNTIRFLQHYATFVESLIPTSSYCGSSGLGSGDGL